MKVLVQAAFFITFIISSGTLAWAVALARGPYLQMLDGSSVTIVWTTDVAAACALSIKRVGGAATLLKGVTGRVCSIAVEGLARGASYAYVPQADGKALERESVFATEPLAGQPYTFLVLGDSGCGCEEQMAVRDLMLTTPAGFALHTGDMAYDRGTNAEFDRNYFAPYRDLLRRMVMWPSLGNHDVKSGGGKPWVDAFVTPANNAEGSERYYSFDYANAHVTVLNSNVDMAPGTDQYRFLEEDLAASAATWKFLVFHHSVYSSGKHSSSTGIRAELQPLIDMHGVDIVFMGHDHHYERTKPMRDDEVVGPGEGATYITTGGGGGPARSVGSKRFTAYAEQASHFVRVAVDDGFLRADMVRMDGEIRDSLTLTKATGVVEAAASVAKKTPTQRSVRPDLLYVDGGAAAKRAILRARVSDVGSKSVTGATLRLQVADVGNAGSDAGGRLHLARSCSWQETSVVWNTLPAFDSAVLDSAGAVVRGELVDFDVSKVVKGNGTFCFVLETPSEDGVSYAGRESTEGAPPKLILTVGP